MSVYRAKYYDGEKPDSILVDIRIKNVVLEISEGEKIIDHWPLKLIYHDKSQLTAIQLACRGEDNARIELLDKEFLSELKDATGFKVKDPLNFKRKEVFFWIAGVLIFIGVVILSMKPISRYIASQISLEAEKKLLESFASFMSPEFCKLSPENQKIWEKLVARLHPLNEDDHRVVIEVKFVKNPTENAFALPGGEIWIYEGLLKKSESPEELAGILAHEIEHVKQRHVLESVVRGTFLTALINLAAGDVSGVLLVDPQTAVRLISLSYGREMETKADKGAMERLEKAKVSPRGIIGFFERNQKISGSIPAFISTHPGSDERMNFFKGFLSAEKENVPVLKGEEWSALKTACQTSPPE